MTVDYATYIASPAWRRKRQAALTRAGHRCQRCGVQELWQPLQVHHLTYDRLGDERPEDLQVVCVPCHERADRERKQRTQRTRFERGLITFARKKYGLEPDDIDQSVADEFADWLDS